MEITEVRVKLTSNQSDRVRAFCSVTFDREFVVRDIKVIEGTGGLFVAMPSRKISDHCPKCRGKNHLRAKYCNECGAKLRDNRAPRDGAGRSKLHADIAHPINMSCRERLQTAILAEYDAEVERSKQPGYKPMDLDVGEYDDAREQPADETRPSHEEKGDAGEFDSGAEYAALIAELRSERPDRGRRPKAPDEPSRKERPKDRSGPQEAEPKPDSGHDTEHEFGKGIL